MGGKREREGKREEKKEKEIERGKERGGGREGDRRREREEGRKKGRRKDGDEKINFNRSEKTFCPTPTPKVVCLSHGSAVW